jgi:hypothetical protein
VYFTVFPPVCATLRISASRNVSVLNGTSIIAGVENAHLTDAKLRKNNCRNHQCKKSGATGMGANANSKMSKTVFSQQHCKALSESLKQSDAVAANMSRLAESNRGRKLTEEHKAAIGAARKAAWDKLKAEREAKQRGIA